VPPGGGGNKVKKQTVVVAAGILMIFALGATSLYAQKTEFQTTFKFMVGKEEAPPGTYRVEALQGGQNNLAVRSAETGHVFYVPILTRISAKSANEASVVFDKVGDTYYLAEVYMAGSDGYHLQGAPGSHTHVKVGSHSGTH
jgi:hypothetical protein